MHHDIVALLDEDHGRLIELSRLLRACPHPARALARFDELLTLRQPGGAFAEALGDLLDAPGT